MPPVAISWIFALVGVHEEEAADALALVLGRVVDALARLEDAAVDADVGEAADIRVGHDLEGDGAEGSVIRDRAGDFAAVLRIRSFDRGKVNRAREVVDHGVEHELNALVLEGRTAQHRDREACQRRPPDGGLQLVHADVVALEVADRNLVVDVADAFDEALAGVESGLLQVLGDLAALRLVAFLAAEPPPALFEEVDAAIELGF